MAFFPLIFFFYMEVVFRDPDRVIPKDKNIFVSPVDGMIRLIKKNREDDYIQGEATQISISVSVRDVHVTRAPCDGKVEVVKHTPSGSRAFYRDLTSLSDQDMEIVFDTEHGRVLIRQFAGILTRKAVCKVRPGESIKRGERYGTIRYRSSLDLYLPGSVEIRVMAGQKVKAGESILATISAAPQTGDSKDWLAV